MKILCRWTPRASQMHTTSTRMAASWIETLLFRSSGIRTSLLTCRMTRNVSWPWIRRYKRSCLRQSAKMRKLNWLTNVFWRRSRNYRASFKRLFSILSCIKTKTRSPRSLSMSLLTVLEQWRPQRLHKEHKGLKAILSNRTLPRINMKFISLM